MGAPRPGSHRWFSLGKNHHKRHPDLQGPAVLVHPEKNKPSGRYVSAHSEREQPQLCSHSGGGGGDVKRERRGVGGGRGLGGAGVGGRA